MFRTRLFLLISAVGAAWACGDAVTPVPEADFRSGLGSRGMAFPPHVLRWESGARPAVLVVEATDGSGDVLRAPGDGDEEVQVIPLKRYGARFWAFNHRKVKLEIRYAIPHSPPYLRLEIPPRSLYQWPDGQLIGPRDSVEITVQADSTQLLVRFAPAGLRFVPGRRPHDADHPACRVLLEIFYGEIPMDANHDGRVSKADAKLLRQLSLWHQLQPDGPWEKHPAEHFIKERRFKAPICGFSGYAISF